MTPPMVKYPRTRHLEGSRLQPGDADLEAAAFAEIAGRPLAVEEKIDGANAAISFGPAGELLLQSRGHYLTGGARERHFAPLKAWTAGLREALWSTLGPRFVMYGEWTHAKHTIYYDALPHYFLEFDILDRETGRFLSTPARRALIGALPVCSVPVLHLGLAPDMAALKALIGRSAFKSDRWRERLAEASETPPHRPEMVRRQTDASELMEGLYVKIEEEGAVTGRYKYVRHDFLAVVRDSESHWQSRPILPNRLAKAPP